MYSLIYQLHRTGFHQSILAFPIYLNYFSNGIILSEEVGKIVSGTFDGAAFNILHGSGSQIPVNKRGFELQTS